MSGLFSLLRNLKRAEGKEVVREGPELSKDGEGAGQKLKVLSIVGQSLRDCKNLPLT